MQNNELDVAARLTRKPSRLESDRLAEMERIFADLLDAVGEDRNRQGLAKTPSRAARSLQVWEPVT